MIQASISELKNNLSAELRKVAKGETLVVTDHKRPVAEVRAIRNGLISGPAGSAIAAGLISPPREAPNLSKFMTLPLARCSNPLTAALNEEREER